MTSTPPARSRSSEGEPPFQPSKNHGDPMAAALSVGVEAFEQGHPPALQTLSLRMAENIRVTNQVVPVDDDVHGTLFLHGAQIADSQEVVAVSW